MPPILQIENLSTHFETARGTVKAVDGVDLCVNEGDTLGIAGESGCGKTVLALSVMRLVPRPPGRIVSGRILFEGEDLLAFPEEEMRRIRGKRISMIFQEPMSSLNPVFRIGDQVAETLRLHEGLSSAEAHHRAVEMLRLVGIPAPETRARDYPHQMSGGMRQRVMIAMALSCRPRLMLADEPTTALDVTIQAQIMALLQEMREQEKMAVLLITHDLGVVHDFADRTAIMYLGRIVEIAPTRKLFADPVHPYTQGLLASLPGRNRGEKRLPSIPGTVPDLSAVPPGCPFAPRCPFRQGAIRRYRAGTSAQDDLAVCDRTDPSLSEYAPGHLAACHHQRSARGGAAR